MPPSPRRQAVVVGLFVTVATAILGGAVVAVGDVNDTFTRKLAISALFDEVNGLQKGDNVWFSGLKVGMVSRLGFENGSEVQVEMMVDRSAAEHIPSDALARIGSDGLIGNRIIVVYGGTPSARPVRGGDSLQIGTAVSTEQIMATLQDNNTNLLAITNDLKGITGKLAAGEGSLGRLLREDELYREMAGAATSLHKSAATAETLTSSLSLFAQKLNRPGGLPNDLVTDRSTYTSLTETVADLHRAGERANDLVSGLARGASDPRTPLGTLMHDDAAGADLKGTLQGLHRSSQLLAQDLEAMQHNFLLRGFFKRKAKQDAELRAGAEGEAEESPTPAGG